MPWAMRPKTYIKQRNGRYQTPPPDRCCPWWVIFSVRLDVKSVLRPGEYTPTYVAIVSTREVIRKTGST